MAGPLGSGRLREAAMTRVVTARMPDRNPPRPNRCGGHNRLSRFPQVAYPGCALTSVWPAVRIPDHQR